MDNHPSYGGIHRIIGHGSDLAFAGFAVTREVHQLHQTVRLGMHRERDAFIVLQVVERHGIRTRLAVEHFLVKGAVRRIVDVEVQAFHHIEHHRGRLQRLHLVVHIRAGLKEVEITHHAGCIAQRVSFGILLEEKRSSAGVYRRRCQKINGGHAEGHYQ